MAVWIKEEQIHSARETRLERLISAFVRTSHPGDHDKENIGRENDWKNQKSIWSSSQLSLALPY